MVYITQQQKEEWEAKINECNNTLANLENIPRERRNKEWDISHTVNKIMLEVYSTLSLNSTILPVEESWDSVEFCYEYALEELEEQYPNGVIIKLDK